MEVFSRFDNFTGARRRGGYRLRTAGLANLGETRRENRRSITADGGQTR